MLVVVLVLVLVSGLVVLLGLVVEVVVVVDGAGGAMDLVIMVMSVPW